MKIPTKAQCFQILKDNSVPDNVIAHTSKVCEVSLKIADLLIKKGIGVNKDLVAAGALLHDVKKLSPNDHVIEGHDLMNSLGYSEVGQIIKKHGLANIDEEEFIPKTWEEKIVFYADKRVKNDKIVTVEKRFEYIKLRYKRKVIEKELNFTKAIEKELLQGEPI
jgi:uncharacterized protein